MSKLNVQVQGDSLSIGPVTITFHRTLRIPDNGQQYPLPPSLGPFPLRRVEDHADKVPESWRAHGGVFLPMYQREAMWLSFHGRHWKPNAIKVAVGKINAISGRPWSPRLHYMTGTAGEPDYMVVPTQPWLDGINAGAGYIKQFVAMPLGMGYTVEGQVTGKEEFGGIQLCVYDPKPGKFPDQPPAHRLLRSTSYKGDTLIGSMEYASASPSASAFSASAKLDSSLVGQEMGLAAGGRMRQKIYEDPHGVDTWDQDATGRCYVHIVNSQMWTQITGEQMPPTPVSVQAYANAGLPWFDLYDDHLGDVKPADELEKVKSVHEMDDSKGFTGQQDDSSVAVPEGVVKKYKVEDGALVKDGEW